MTSYLGVDLGRKRIGLSVGDDRLSLALPIPALVIGENADPVFELARIVQERRIDIVVFGYPLNMDGSVGDMAEYVDSFIDSLKKNVPSGVKFVKSDERLTSNQAEEDQKMYRKGRFESVKKKRKNRKSGMIDSNAAAIILQDYLDELRYELAKKEGH